MTMAAHSKIFPTNWSDERVDQLKALWAEGLSASQIARKIGDCTRNAVIGKVCRLGLPPRLNTITSARRALYEPPRRVVRPRIIPPPKLDQPEPLGAWGEMLGPGLCKFIHGEIGGQWRMCGHETGAAINPWCPICRAVVFNKEATQRSNQAAESSESKFEHERELRKVGLG